MLRAQNYKHDLGGTVKDFFIVFAYQIAIICAWFFSEGRPERATLLAKLLNGSDSLGAPDRRKAIHRFPRDIQMSLAGGAIDQGPPPRFLLKTKLIRGHLCKNLITQDFTDLTGCVGQCALADLLERPWPWLPCASL